MAYNYKNPTLPRTASPDSYLGNDNAPYWQCHCCIPLKKVVALVRLLPAAGKLKHGSDYILRDGGLRIEALHCSNCIYIEEILDLETLNPPRQRVYIVILLVSIRLELIIHIHTYPKAKHLYSIL
jgi:hypothetical protein